MTSSSPPPRDDAERWAFNSALIEQCRQHDGALDSGRYAGRELLLLTTKGARSGRPRTTPLAFSRDGDRLVVIASKGGSPSHPAWFHNLVANPIVTIELGTDRYAARAVVPEGAERERLYAAQSAELPQFLEYQKRTTRLIPVVVFERLDGDHPEAPEPAGGTPQ